MVSGARLQLVCLLHPPMWCLGFHPMMSEKHHAVGCRDLADGTAGRRIRQTAVDAATLALARRFCHFTTDCQDRDVQQQDMPAPARPLAARLGPLSTHEPYGMLNTPI